MRTHYYNFYVRKTNGPAKKLGTTNPHNEDADMPKLSNSYSSKLSIGEQINIGGFVYDVEKIVHHPDQVYPLDNIRIPCLNVLLNDLRPFEKIYGMS